MMDTTGVSKLRIAKATESENIAVKWFKSRGFIIADRGHAMANGQDFTAIKDGRTWRVEVKSAIRGHKCWRVQPVLKSRHADDLVAVVLGDTVHVEVMSDYLKCCSRNGSRRITRLVEFLRATEDHAK